MSTVWHYYVHTDVTYKQRYEHEATKIRCMWSLLTARLHVICNGSRRVSSLSTKVRSIVSHVECTEVPHYLVKPIKRVKKWLDDSFCDFSWNELQPLYKAAAVSVPRLHERYTLGLSKKHMHAQSMLVSSGISILSSCRKAPQVCYCTDPQHQKRLPRE